MLVLFFLPNMFNMQIYINEIIIMFISKAIQKHDNLFWKNINCKCKKCLEVLSYNHSSICSILSFQNIIPFKIPMGEREGEEINDKGIWIFHWFSSKIDTPPSNKISLKNKICLFLVSIFIIYDTYNIAIY